MKKKAVDLEIRPGVGFIIVKPKGHVFACSMSNFVKRLGGHGPVEVLEMIWLGGGDSVNFVWSVKGGLLTRSSQEFFRLALVRSRLWWLP